MLWDLNFPGCARGCMGIGGPTEASDLLLLGLQLVVAGFSTHVEIVRAHEIANEVRRVKKQLKDCQQLAMLYNNRERIFGLPITNVGLLWAHCPPALRRARGGAHGICGHVWSQLPGGRALAFGGGAGLSRLQRRAYPHLPAPRARRLPGPKQEAGGSVQALLSHSEPRAHGGKEEGRPGLSPWGQDQGQQPGARRGPRRSSVERDWGAPRHSPSFSAPAV